MGEVEEEDVGRRGDVGMRMMALIWIRVGVHWTGWPLFIRGERMASDTSSADSGWTFKNRMSIEHQSKTGGLIERIQLTKNSRHIALFSQLTAQLESHSFSSPLPSSSLSDRDLCRGRSG